MLVQIGAYLGILAAAAAVAAFMARAVAASIWRERAEALAGQVAELRAEVGELRTERQADKQLIRFLTAQKNHFQSMVRKLTARVAELERRLRDAGIPDDQPHH